MEDGGLEEVEAVGNEFVTVGPNTPDLNPPGQLPDLPEPSRN
jgi:hypothetical protein